MGSAAPGSRSACGASATRKGQDAYGAQGRAVAVGWMKRLKACLRGVALRRAGLGPRAVTTGWAGPAVRRCRRVASRPQQCCCATRVSGIRASPPPAWSRARRAPERRAGQPQCVRRPRDARRHGAPGAGAPRRAAAVRAAPERRANGRARWAPPCRPPAQGSVAACARLPQALCANRFGAVATCARWCGEVATCARWYGEVATCARWCGEVAPRP